MQTYYAARAPYYDAVYLKPERANDLALLQDHIPSRLAGLSVLEVACGTGYWTQYLAQRVARLTATDWTPEPLQFAKLRPNVDGVSFVEADAYALPASVGQFNGAFAGLWFSHVPVAGRQAFLQSLHARLVPGARVILLDNSEVQCRELPIAERDADGNTYQHRLLRDGTVHRVLKNFPSGTELSALVSSVAAVQKHTQLENFWLFEYELKSAT
jgi:demethylmenaquinone methyltransferase/2-methoxy-6-polyprenyl-1,4-benzoquinol methylase